MNDVAAVVLSWTISTATCFLIVILDERRDRAWSLATAAALTTAAFGMFLALAYDLWNVEPHTDPLTAQVSRGGAVLVAVAGLASCIALFFDLRAYSPLHLERSWPPVSRNAALVAFAPFSVAVHFWKSRRYSFVGLLVGLAWLVLSLLPLTLVEVACEAAGYPLPH